MKDVGRKQRKTRTESQGRATGLLSGMLRDPVVRWMIYASGGLTILFLLTVIGALVTGVVTSTGPRTTAERDLQLASELVNKGAVGAAWAPYIDALVATGDVNQARVALGRARASAPATAPVMALDLSEARILSAERRYADAAEMADKAMRGYQARQKASLAAPATAAAARASGLPEDYYNAALVKAYAKANDRKYGEAVAAFDIYISHSPTASDILIDRGNAKAELKDRAGAEKDFRAALKYVPYDKEAKAGLKKIGATQ